MHIILGILGIVAALSYYLFVFRNVGRAASDTIDAAQRLRGHFRRKAFRKQAEGSTLTAIDDPASAAAVMFAVIAKNGPAWDGAIKDHIASLLRDKIGIKDWEEELVFAEWASRQEFDINHVSRTFKELWRRTLPEAAREDLVEMALSVMSFHDEPGNDQLQALEYLRRALKLPI